MDRRKLVRAGGEPFLYIPVNHKAAPENLTPRQLWDLWDLALKFGQPKSDGGFGVAVLSDVFSLTVYDYRDNGMGGSFGMFIAKLSISETGHLISSTSAGAFMFDLLNGMHIMWDRYFSASDIGRLLYQYDKYAYRKGDIVAGERVFWTP